MDRPFIVVNSALVDLLDEEELRFVLGHELGHALSGHARLPDDAAAADRLSGVLTGSRSARSGLRAIIAALHGVVPQGRAVRRPRRPARHPGPRGRVPRADEAGQRRSPRRPRPDVVLRPGRGVRRRRRPARLRAQAAADRGADAPDAGLRAHRAAALGRRRRAYTRSSPATTRRATDTTPRSARPPRRPRAATPTRSATPRTLSVGWPTTRPAGWAVPRCGSTSSGAVAATRTRRSQT